MYNYYLSNLIRKSGISQKEFCRKTGINVTTLSLIIHDVRKSPINRQRIADYFGKPLTTIFKRR